MGNCLYTGKVDVTISTFITGYVPRSSPWQFNFGATWPCTSGTKLGTGGASTTIVGAWCDIFSKLGNTPQQSLNTWGDLTPATSSGNWNPSFDGIDSIHGLHFATSGGNTAISDYNYPITLGANSSFPSSGGALPAGINPNLITTITGGVTPAFQKSGAITWKTNNTICNFYIPSLFANMVDSAGVITGVTGPSSRSVAGSAFNGLPLICAYDNDGSGNQCFASIASTGITAIPTTWDDAVVDVWMKATGGGNGTMSTTVCALGFISYIRGPVTIKGNVINAGLIVTTLDLQHWSLINLLAGDANATTALGTGLGLARTAQITPDNLVWFQNSLTGGIADKIFVGPLSTGGTGIINAQPPLSLNCMPRYDPCGLII